MIAAVLLEYSFDSNQLLKSIRPNLKKKQKTLGLLIFGLKSVKNFEIVQKQ